MDVCVRSGPFHPLFVGLALCSGKPPVARPKTARSRGRTNFVSYCGPAGKARSEILAIQCAVAEESADLLDPAFRKPLLVAILIALFSQFTGINTIIYYGSLVFLKHVPRQTANTALWANTMIGAINFLATPLWMYLIDRAGWKPLLMSAFAGHGPIAGWGGGGDSCRGTRRCGIGFGWSIDVVCFAVGVGTGTWVVMSEICPTRIRGR